MTRSTLMGGLAALALVCATTGSVAHAQSLNQNGQPQNQNGQPQNQNQNNAPRLSATPELDSSLLFGVGLLGLGAATSVLRRVGRRREPDR